MRIDTSFGVSATLKGTRHSRHTANGVKAGIRREIAR